MTRVLTVLGARPQFIKAAPVSKVFREEFGSDIEEILLNTGQHYDDDMSRIFFEELDLPRPATDLGVGAGEPVAQMGKIMEGVAAAIRKYQPDLLMVYGDTTTTLSGALAAQQEQVPVVHVEAGLRSFNKRMPEEVNRLLTDQLSTLLMVPTPTGLRNLEREGFDLGRKSPWSPDHPGIFHAGDVMLDAHLLFSEVAARRSTVLKDQGLEEEEFVLTTIHRPVNTDDKDQLKGLLDILDQLGVEKKVPVVLPLHPRTRKAMERFDLSFDRKGIRFLPPASFLDMLVLEQAAKGVLTDSGGVQKEAFFAGKPCVILREETEWKELVETGNSRLAGADPEKIREGFEAMVEGTWERESTKVFGEGQAARFIGETLKAF